MPASDHLRELINLGLCEHLPVSGLRRAESLNEALRYALFPGGKRLRPKLTLLGAQVVNGRLQDAMPAACAVEFLHTSSLIFDDLPAMDDAEVRRGNPALHIACGEGIALLTGLALLNQAYALFSGYPDLVAEAAACIGVNGMIGGQAVDLEWRPEGSIRAPFTERNRKTSALMRLTMTAGAIACGASELDVAALAEAGECLGEAYQVCDDLLDRSLESHETGKTCRQDERHQRPSHAAEFGAEECQFQVWDLVARAKGRLTERFGTTASVRTMLTSIDGIVNEFARTGLVSACSS